MSPLEITLVILLVTIIAFVSGKVPFSVISTGIILALILTGIKTPAEAFGGFINTNVVMFVAMFVIGAGLTKTPLIDKAQSLVIRYKDNMRMLIFLSCVAGAFLGAITSATATAAIMIPLLVGIANDIGVSRSKLLYPSMACANIATQMTFLGQGASNMAWNDVMMQAGAPTPLHIWDFTIARIPMLTIAILYMTFVGYKLMPDIPNEQFSDAAHTASESEKLSPFKRKLAVLIVLVSIAMMLLENVIGVKMYLTSCIGAAALVLTGVLTEREALNSIHEPTIFLFSGVLALSNGVSSDFRELEQAAEKDHHRATVALEIFEYRVRKMIAEYAAAMGGVDVVVFTAGVGENSAETRAHILQGLEFMGITCDPEKNRCRGKEQIISRDGAPVIVMVVPTNEELMIAQDTMELVLDQE